MAGVVVVGVGVTTTLVGSRAPPARRECLAASSRRAATVVEGGAASADGCGVRAGRCGVVGASRHASFAKGGGSGGGGGLSHQQALRPPRRQRRGRAPTTPITWPSTVSPKAFVTELTEFAKGVADAIPEFVKGTLPEDLLGGLRLLPVLTLELMSEAALVIAATFGAGAIINAPGQSMDDDTATAAKVSDTTKQLDRGGGDGRGGWKQGGGGGGGSGDDPDAWHFEDPDGDDHNFFIHGGAAGVWWLLFLLALAAYCFLLAKSPHWGVVWVVAAIGLGWGMFLTVAGVTLGVIGAGLGVNHLLNARAAGLPKNMLTELTEIVKGIADAMPAIDPAALPADKKDVTSNPNPRLPKGVHVLGTDAQVVQVELKAGQELSAEPGSMCYMSSNVSSVTTLFGGFLAGVARVLAGEPFFINTFKNIGKEGKDGYIALAGKREGDKIIVLDLQDIGGEFLCARDAYMCSTGIVNIEPATSLTRGQMGLRLFLSSQNTFIMQKLTGSGIACISGNGTVIRQDLRAGQEMVVDARAVVGFTKTMGYQLRMVSSPLAAVFGGEGLFFARLSGPGTFYLQSLPAARQASLYKDEGEFSV